MNTQRSPVKKSSSSSSGALSKAKPRTKARVSEDPFQASKGKKGNRTFGGVVGAGHTKNVQSMMNFSKLNSARPASSASVAQKKGSIKSSARVFPTNGRESKGL